MQLRSKPDSARQSISTVRRIKHGSNSIITHVEDDEAWILTLNEEEEREKPLHIGKHHESLIYFTNEMCEKSAACDFRKQKEKLQHVLHTANQQLLSKDKELTNALRAYTRIELMRGFMGKRILSFIIALDDMREIMQSVLMRWASEELRDEKYDSFKDREAIYNEREVFQYMSRVYATMTAKLKQWKRNCNHEIVSEIDACINMLEEITLRYRLLDDTTDKLILYSSIAHRYH